MMAMPKDDSLDHRVGCLVNGRRIYERHVYDLNPETRGRCRRSPISTAPSPSLK